MAKQHIMITGASKGLGKAIAIALSEEDIMLTLISRDSEKLLQVKEICNGKGAIVNTYIADITNSDEIATVIYEAHKIRHITMVIANAGISISTSKKETTLEKEQDVLNTNINGTLNTIHPVIECMKQDNNVGGHVVIINSIASFLTFSRSPAYVASKAAIRYYATNIKKSLSEDNIHISLVCPGYIDTDMTRSKKVNSLLMDTPEKAAKFIISRLSKKPTIIAFPLYLYCILNFISFLGITISETIFDKILFRLIKRFNMS